MPDMCDRVFNGSFRPRAAAALVFVAASGLSLVQPVSAQVFHSVIQIKPTYVLAEATASNPENVRLLVGLASMQRGMMLGLLFADQALANMPESHFADPRADLLPGLKDGLAAAGVADLEPLLIAIEGATDMAGLLKSQSAANTALLIAESSLHAEDKDTVLAVIEAVREANARLNTSGPTDVVNFQEVWGTLMIQRGKIDLLMQSGNPVVSAASTDMATALDNVILSMPDPMVSEPVAFDAAPVAALLAQLEGLASGL
jgi:hypothetical protein